MFLSFLFKNRKKKSNESLSEKCDKFKVKVKPFDSECNYYVIYYSFNGGLTWKRYERNSLWSSEELCDDAFPVLFRDFDEAVAKAKSMTAENIKAWITQQKAEFNDHIDKIRRRFTERNKTFIS